MKVPISESNPESEIGPSLHDNLINSTILDSDGSAKAVDLTEWSRGVSGSDSRGI